MVVGTINDAVTMAGGEGALLAGRYRIVKPLGRGGMGSVWLAEDTLLDGKLFAVKMLPSVLVSNKRAYRQLKDEALVAMKLTHPNIVTLRAFEENDGNPFLVMDYIEGQTLDDYLADEGNGERGTGNCRARTPGVPFTGGLPEEEVIRILRPIAEALDYAHKKGVVHRDVKPGNVMIASDGTPYILDFGIAREIQETMTRVTGKLSSGTLLYMSPEQLNGDPPKSAQDIYSFAATVYECIKGEPPFCRGQVEHQILNEEPEPLPEGTRFCASVKAGLAKSPEERPMTCVAVLDGVVPRRVAEPRRGGGAGKAIGVLALLAALGAGGYYGWVKHEEALKEYAGPKHGDRKTLTLPGGAKMEMIYVGSGEFMMGSDTGDAPSESDEKTLSGKHKVKISKGFWLGKYEVTQEQWQKVMGDNPSYFKSNDRPVENVSWEDCQRFVQKVNAATLQQFGGAARLPTEAEWEYACRAGTDSSLPNGQDLVVLGQNNGQGLDSIAWYGGNSCVDFELSNGYDCSGWTGKEFGGSKAGTHPVGKKVANRWGFHDMIGNVWEWCQDRYDSDYYSKSPVNDPCNTASGDARVLRGGCWLSFARFCRSAGRLRYDPGVSSSRYGFRLCCSAGPRE